MNPTNKLVSDMVAMQACYVNTTHPDFLNGHKAMAIVNDRMNANKPVEKAVDPKTGKLPAGALNNGKDLDTDVKKEEQSFFNSFFAKDKQPKRKGGQMDAPPTLIKPVASSNDRELMETEVISESSHQARANVRTPYHVLFLRRQARNDRYGPKSHHAHPCQLCQGEPAAGTSGAPV